MASPGADSDCPLVGSWSCGDGVGLAVCEALGVVATTCVDSRTVTLRSIDPPSFMFPVVAEVGGAGDGPCQFNFNAGDGTSGWCCFTLGPAPTLLVAEHGNRRVHELDPCKGLAHVSFLPVTLRPRGVAASPTHIAVTAWDQWAVGEHCLYVFDAGTRALLRTIGAHWQVRGAAPAES
jgi:hypothetical protein